MWNEKIFIFFYYYIAILGCLTITSLFYIFYSILSTKQKLIYDNLVAYSKELCQEIEDRQNAWIIKMCTQVERDDNDEDDEEEDLFGADNAVDEKKEKEDKKVVYPDEMLVQISSLSNKKSKSNHQASVYSLRPQKIQLNVFHLRIEKQGFNENCSNYLRNPKLPLRFRSKSGENNRNEKPEKW